MPDHGRVRAYAVLLLCCAMLCYAVWADGASFFVLVCVVFFADL
jgi:hypothetical protein